MPMPDARRHSPAAERNAGPILSVLQEWLPPAGGSALEVASGTGQHVACFAAALPGWTWQPTDFDPAALPSIASWTEGLPGVLPPRQLDVTASDWGLPRYDLLYCANMIHIAPWAACLGLLRGAAAHLQAGGRLVLYGPYRIDGQHTAPSNAAFDTELRQRDPAWGVRDLGEVRQAALAHRLALVQQRPMPANNLCLLFQAAA
ncbi:DUF938 domain-containing protein [Eleftheria terrae]|uniref:DUF938 domain-containing protein n=1 Tax=Eleftheria terrae TaxID=1597781 RepID=UPI00263A454A|nr:DUF938 domain-containing protein [Eleftheria terrae]WKB52274.1 class I SAM-dependent methyltransferase [Eleftheria terrae]